MLPLSHIRDLRARVDGEWRSPVADTIAAAWDIAPGAARYWRSSATHVFVVPIAGVRRWLRFAPIVHPAADRLRTGVTLAQHWVRVGAAQPLPTLDGDTTIDIDTPAGRMRATLTEDAAGAELSVDDESDADADDARASSDQMLRWGAALATLHAAPMTDGARTPQRTYASAQDAALADRIAALEARTAALPTTEHGIIHGDFELDNIRFDGDVVRCFDFDEGGAAAFATDIALATRDLTPGDLATFIDGYRSVRAISTESVDLLPVCAALEAARLAADVHAAVDLTPTADDPDWLVSLHAGLLTFIDAHRGGVGETRPAE